MGKLIKEFKEFAFKGNVIDMAVGVMIGSAFSKIVTSLVNDIFMPLLSVLTGSVSFTDMAVKLGEGEEAAKFAYGNFIQTVVDFLLIAVCIFAFVKLITKLRERFEEKEEAKPKEPARLCPFCKTEIHKEATRCPHCTSELGK